MNTVVSYPSSLLGIRQRNIHPLWERERHANPIDRPSVRVMDQRSMRQDLVYNFSPLCSAPFIQSFEPIKPTAVMADTIEEAAALIVHDLQSVLGMTVAEYLTTSLHRDLSSLDAASALSKPPALPHHSPIMVAEYKGNGRHGMVAIMRSKVESWKEAVCVYFSHGTATAWANWF